MGQIRGDLSDIKYAVFDDFNFDNLGRNAKSWFGAQSTFTITDKYKAKRTINWGKPIIWLCNPEDFPTPCGSPGNWFEQNSIVVHLTNKLF